MLKLWRHQSSKISQARNSLIEKVLPGERRRRYSKRLSSLKHHIIKPPTSGLFKLPLELRLEVFKYLEDDWLTPALEEPTGCPNPFLYANSLMYTNRQLFHEITDYLRRKHGWTTLSFDCPRQCLLFVGLTAECLNEITRIEMRVLLWHDIAPKFSQIFVQILDLILLCEERKCALTWRLIPLSYDQIPENADGPVYQLFEGYGKLLKRNPVPVHLIPEFEEGVKGLSGRVRDVGDRVIVRRRCGTNHYGWGESRYWCWEYFCEVVVKAVGVEGKVGFAEKVVGRSVGKESGRVIEIEDEDEVPKDLKVVEIIT